VASPDEARGGDLCGGAHALVAVQLSPVDGANLDNGFAVEVMHHLDGEASMAYAVQFLDPHGREIAPATQTPIVRLEPGEKLDRRAAAPSGIPDGYYQIRVVAAAADSKQSGRGEAMIYLLATRGKLTQITSDEYYAGSDANVGVRVLQ
jgi:hypothetical protein